MNEVTFEESDGAEASTQSVEMSLREKLEYWHQKDEYLKIVSAIRALQEDQQADYDLQGKLARALNNLSCYQEAIQVMDAIREEGEQDPIWWYRMGYSYYYLNEEEKAETCFKRAVELDPEDGDCWFFLAMIYLLYVPDEARYVEAMERLHQCDTDLYQDVKKAEAALASKASQERNQEPTQQYPSYDPERVFQNNSVFPSDYVLCGDMVRDDYFPDFLVKRIQIMLREFARWLQSAQCTYGDIQAKLDQIVRSINEMEAEFHENDSEIETMARESIAESVYAILHFYGIQMDIEEALRERDW